MAVSYEDIVQGAYGSVGRTGIGAGAGQIDEEGYNFWLNALKAGAVTPDQLIANFNKSVAETVQQQPQAVNSQAVASYIASNPLATQIDPKKVVAVGDSTTWGYSDGNQVTENMVTTAQKALGSDYSVSNLGINSTTAGDFLNSGDFDKALSSGAGTVVLNYGMNEAYKNVDPATFANNLLTAVQTLQAVGKNVILQTPNATGFSTKPVDAWTQNVGTYADVVRSVSQQTGSTLDDKFSYTSTLKDATSPTDIVHPTATTYGLLGTNLADAIKTTTTGVAPKAISVTAPVTAAQTPSLVANQATVGTGAEATTSKEDAVTKIKNQIIAQGTTSQWSGQGLGSAEANAADMARMLASAGITDINQFGKVPALEPVVPIETLYNGKRVFTQTDEDGKTSRYIYEPTGKTLTYNSTDTGEVTYPESRVVEVPKDAKLETVYGAARDNGEYGTSYVPVDPSKIKTVDGKLVGDTGQTTFGNKLTGQVVANNFETGSNAFGGTFAGKGKTGYRVQFAADGTPVFYTGAESSSDIGQVMPFLQIALAASGAGGLLGSELLGAGASEIAKSALGNAILGGATQGLAGGDVLQGALLGGAGGALSGYLQGGGLDASGITERQFAIADATQLAEQGLSASQIRDALISGGYNDIIIDRALNAISSTSPTIVSNPVLDNNTVSITGTAVPSLNNVINTIAQVPTIVTTANRPDQVSPDVINAVTSILGSDAILPPEIKITDKSPTKTEIPVITPPPVQVSPDVLSAVTSILGGSTITPPEIKITDKSPVNSDIPVITPITTPVVANPTITTPDTKDTSLTASDVIKILGIGTTLAGLNAATSGGSTSGGTQYPIVDVPASWATPPKPSVGPATVLPPINFGDRNLLRGTQWEKFLDPKYGLVPEPIKYSQPSSLSYNDLMSILGSKQGMPSASTLSINDIISGIQNQYGQARSGTMG